LQTQAQVEERQRKKNVDQQSRTRPGLIEIAEKQTSTVIETTEPQNFTICAPQLLHLDRQNRPLWFNGWILSNKFAEKRAKVGGRFELYLKEPTDGRRDPDPWQLEENNEACLTADETFKFTPEEVQTLDLIVTIAKEVGAWGKSGKA
jgi:hypothetical protein